MRITFCKPPFFRFLGSHNPKVSVELSYWRAAAERLRHQTELYNADYTPARKFWSWRTLYERGELYRQVVDGACDPMLLETVETVLSLKPDIVVISSDDVFIPTVCTDNAFINARLASFFRKSGIFTVGVGKFYETDDQFSSSFDVLLRGGPNEAGIEQIVLAKNEKRSGVIVKCGDWDTTLQPEIRGVMPVSSDMDYSNVVTRRGCSYPCSFCYNTLVSPRFIPRPVDLVVEDISRRMLWTRQTKYYFTDQIFTINMPHLQALADAFRDTPVSECSFTAEGRSELIAKKPEMVDLIKAMGVKVVKMGVENIGNTFNASSEKKQAVEGIKIARQLLRDAGIHAVAYLLLGGETSTEEYRETLQFCKDVDFDSYVVNFWSFPINELGTDKYKYDAHFIDSARWDIPQEIINEYFDLHASKKGNPALSIFGLS